MLGRDAQMMATLHSMADHSAAPTLSSGREVVRLISGDSIEVISGVALTGWIGGVGNHEKTLETEDTGNQHAVVYS